MSEDYEPGFTLVKGPSMKQQAPSCPNCMEGKFSTIGYKGGDVVYCNRCLRGWKLRYDNQWRPYWRRYRRADKTTWTGPR